MTILVPLATRMRPQSLAHYIGQDVLNPGTALHVMLSQQQCHSMILWGPPGTGKTTLAHIIAHTCDTDCIELSAVSAGVKDIRAALDKAEFLSRPPIVFIDEIHRFNKSQQDQLLPAIELGHIILIGASTENPAFSCNNALLSRVQIYVLNRLDDAAIAQVCQRAINQDEHLKAQRLSLSDEALNVITRLVNGDARKALTLLELGVKGLVDCSISAEHVHRVSGETVAPFDKDGDYYYDILSAFHKSIRGSSVDGGLYWLARFLLHASDITPIIRRLLAIATEDIGLADPRAVEQCVAAWDTYHRVGPAEGERAVAQACVYCALAPKSNALYSAFKHAKRVAKDTQQHEVPVHLRNAPTQLAKAQGHGYGYRYSHNETHAYSAGQAYLPQGIEPGFYQPNQRGFEKKLQEKIDFLKHLDQNT